MSRRILVFAVAAAAASTVLLADPPAEAYSQCPIGYGCGWHFYSDPAHTNLVGRHTINCDGVVSNWGVQQGYSTYEYFPCQPPPPE